MAKLQEGGVNRALVDGELALADLLDAACDRLPVQRAHGVKGLEDHEVQRAVPDVGRVARHVLVAYSSNVLAVNTSAVEQFMSVDLRIPVLVFASGIALMLFTLVRMRRANRQN